jgi:hypothetical protein
MLKGIGNRMPTSLMLAVFLCLTCALAAMAQEGRSSLTGIITDQNGAAVPNAQVSIVNQETGINRRSTVTSDNGNYSFAALFPGSYKVSVEASGFKTVLKENVKLNVGQTEELNVVLEVGGATETVVITAGAGVIDTTSKEIGGHIGEQELVELPSINRNFIGFVGLVPGVVPNISTESFGSDSVSINGQDPRYNNYLLDGANNNDDVIGQRAGAQARTALESVAEFQVLTNQFDAEFGRTSGGIINAITKTGGNQFHGSGFGFFQSNGLNSSNRFQVLNQLDEPETSMQQFGGTIGGPIKKDFAHFFFSYEKTRIDDGVIINVPARSEFNASTAEKTRATNTMVRGDMQPSQNHEISARWLRESSPQLNQIITAFSRPVTAEASREEADIDQTVVGNWTYIINPETVNDMRISFTRENVAFANPGFNSGNSMIDLPPTLVFNSFVTQQSDVAQARINNSYRLNNTLSWIRGAHTMKYGLEYNYVTADNTNEGDLNGVFLFPTDNDFNASDPATYPERLQIRVGGPQKFVQLNHFFSFFAQDSWKVNRRLTLTLGGRYDKETVSPDNNNISPRVGFAYELGGGGRSVIRGGYGFFYQTIPFELISAFQTAGPFSSSFVTVFPANAADPGPRAGMFPTHPALVNGPVVNRSVIDALVGTGTLLVNTSPFVDNLERRNPYVRTASIGFQHQLASQLALTVDYIHQDGVDQFVTVELNPGTRATTSSTAALTRLYSTLGEVVSNSIIPVDTSLFAGLPFTSSAANSVRTRANLGNTKYDALEISLDRRFHKGVQFKASYTLSKTRGTTSGSAFSTADFQLLNDFRLNLDQGPTDFDRRHNFVFSGVWQVPRTRGFTVSTVIRGLSGTPFTIFNSRVDADRNGINFDPVAAGTYSGTRVFPNGDTLAFTVDNKGGRNGARNPNFFSADLRLAYKYDFNERIKGGFTFEIFNLTNRTNYDGPSGDFRNGTNSLFLVPVSAGTARTLQLGFRLNF